MHKKDILFLISLPDDIKAGMKISYTQYISILRSIERIELRESISQNDLAIADQFPLVVIVGHNNGPEESLILENGTLLPWASIISYLPVSCANTIDIGACKARLGEKSVAEAIKDHCPSIRRVLSPKKSTKVEGRLMIYREMLPSIDLDKDYYEVYCNKVAELKRLKEGRKNQTETLKGTNLGTMSTSAAPETVYRNSPFPVKVYIHADGDELDINVEIKQYQQHKRKNLKLNDGEEIKWDISFDTDPMPEYAKYLKHIVGERTFSDVWKSDNPEIRRIFNFFVEEAFPLNGFNAVLKTTIGENETDEWPFTINVLPYKDLLGGNTSIAVKSDENSISELNSTNIKNVEVDEKKLEAFKDAYKDNADILEHIDKKIEKIHKTDDEISKRLYEDYDSVRKSINANNKTDTHPEHIRCIYILDKRLEMLHAIKEIQRLMVPPITQGKKVEIRTQTGIFFSCLFTDKIDLWVYDALLKRIYTKANGKDVQRFIGHGGPATRAYNGLAIILANPGKGKSNIHHYLLANRTEKIPIKKIEKDKEEVQRHVIPFIEGILSDSTIKDTAKDYLRSDDGHSSVFAYYLCRLFEECKD